MLPALIDTPEALSGAVQLLQSRPSAPLFLDTEFDAVRGGATLCLLQVSDGEQTFLIDPLDLDISPLAPIFGDERAEWVLHAGRQDVALLCGQLRLPVPRRVFDTQIAWALCSPEAGVALAYLEYRLLGARSSKGYQVEDWKRRPLSPGQLKYAARDVAHLPALRERMLGDLCSKGYEEAVYVFSRESLLPAETSAGKLTLESFRNAWQLDAQAQAALVALIGWFNQLPASQVAFIPDSKICLALAARRPANKEELHRIKGVHHRLAHDHGDTLIALWKRAAEEASTDGFVPLDPPPYATHDAIWARARLELLRAHASRLLDVAPELILPARELDRLRPLLAASRDPMPLLNEMDPVRRGLLAPVWSEAIRSL